jgi:hypothetical protein
LHRLKASQPVPQSVLTMKRLTYVMIVGAMKAAPR